MDEEKRQLLEAELQAYEEELESVESAHDDGFELTQLGNAKRFAETFLGKRTFVPETGKWFHWDDNLWKRGDDGQEYRDFEMIIAQIKVERVPLFAQYKAAIDADKDSDETKSLKAKLAEYTTWIKASQNLTTIKNSLTLASTQSGMSTPLTEFDNKGHYFGCTNGVIDLRTGQLITGDSSYLMTKRSPLAFNPDAVCPEWETFLLKIMKGSVENVKFLQRLIGQGMFGNQGKDKLSVFWGSGANGKSTLVDTVKYVLGNYASVTDPSLLIDSNNKGNKEYYLADLMGSRLLIMAETERGDVLAESLIKKIVDSGEVTGRHPGGRPFQYQPVFTPILSTNRRPRIMGDAAIWRRLLLVPFTHTIPEHERNPRFRTEVLVPEAEGILNWCLHGAREFRRIGLAPPKDVLAATSEYQSDQDTLGRFIDERCTVDPKGIKRVKLKEFQELYNHWRRDQEMNAVGVHTLKEDLVSRKMDVRYSTGNVNFVYGITLQPPPEPADLNDRDVLDTIFQDEEGSIS